MAKLPFIQALRALAATLVVVDHALLCKVELGELGPAWRGVAVATGYLGVGVFFVISGFIMAHTAGDGFGRPGAPGRFLGRRALRIVPFYWPLLAVAALSAWLAGGAPDPAGLLADFAFLPHLNRAGLMRPLLGVGWTLNYEMAFYALFAAALCLPRRRGLALLFGALLGLAAVGAAAHPAFAPLRAWTSPVVLLFGLGVALGLRHGRTPLVPAVSVPGLSRLGDASYATYLWHAFTLPVLAKWLHGLPSIPFVLAAVATSHLAGWIAYRTIETPVSAWLRGLRMAKGPPRVEAAPC